MNKEAFEPANLKGTNDYLPKQMVLRNDIIATLKKAFESYGFLPLETGTLCLMDLLAYKYAGGAEILKEVYKLSDQGERSLGLRYDLTVPFAKVISLNKNLRMPFRRYEIGKVFRDGPVKLGRNREFYQCDVDVVGQSGQFIEAEFFKLAVDTFRKLGIEVNIEYNNRKFLSGIILQSGISEAYVSGTILKVDGLKKYGEEAIKKELSELSAEANGIALPPLSQESINCLFRYLNTPVEELLVELGETGNDLIKEGLKELSLLRKYIKEIGIEENCVLLPGLARGLEIYTGAVWEVYDKAGRLSSALGGGGRYDKIITQFMNNGTEYPALGMSFGIEPIFALLSKEDEETNSIIKVYVIPFDESLNGEGLRLATALREQGVNTLIDMAAGTKFKKRLTYANNERIEYIVVLGEDEIINGEITFKNMFDQSKSFKLKINEIPNFDWKTI